MSMMTDIEKKNFLIEFAKDFCNDDFMEDDIQVLPAGVKLFVEKGMSYLDVMTGIKSESLGDHSITTEQDFPSGMLRLLQPYKKVRFL